MSKSPSERASRIAEQHGFNAMAFQALRDGFDYFFHGDGCVAYLDTGAAWVVAGAPLSATEELLEITRAFLRAAAEAGRRVCFFGTEERFVRAAAPVGRSFQIGEQPVWKPEDWTETLARHPSLREQVRRARAKGVRSRELSERCYDAPELRESARALVESWLATRGLAPMGFVVEVAPLSASQHRRCFVAERDGELVGLAYVIPVPGRRGFFIEHLVRAPHAPNGTVELLVDAVMRWAALQGSPWLTLGLAPLSGEVPAPLRIARRRTTFLYDFGGLQRFKAKLRPSAWQPIYVTYPPSQHAVTTIVDVLAAFARKGLLRFALRSLARGPSVALAVLAALLVPWTALLVVAPAEHWFNGHAGVKWAWIVFDALIVCGFVALLRRPAPRLATVLALAVTLDAVVTPLDEAFWKVPRVRSAFDVLVILAACIAPVVAAVVLWGARARFLSIARRRAVPSA